MYIEQIIKDYFFNGHDPVTAYQMGLMKE